MTPDEIDEMINNLPIKPGTGWIERYALDKETASLDEDNMGKELLYYMYFDTRRGITAYYGISFGLDMLYQAMSMNFLGDKQPIFVSIEKNLEDAKLACRRDFQRWS